MMKKYFLFAAALLCLVACNNGSQNEPQAPSKQITLRANVDLMGGNGAQARKIAPDNINASTVNFSWQPNDKVMLVSADFSEKRLFTIVNSSINGNSANFTGDSLSDMSSYYVFYAGEDLSESFVDNLISSESLYMNYRAGYYNLVFGNLDSQYTPHCDANGFTLYSLRNLHMQLKGDVTIGKMEYKSSQVSTVVSTLNFGSSGLQLTSTPIDICLPINSYNDNQFFLNFYDTNGDLIVTKKGSTTEETCLKNYEFELANIGVVEVKAE